MGENSVNIDVSEFLDLLKYANGDVSAITKFPQYRGKEIIIDGDLKLNGLKNINNLNVISRINGDLDIGWSSVDYFDSSKVSGRFSYHGSRMWDIEQKKILQKKLNLQERLRSENAWDVSTNTNVANESEAVYLHLEDNGIPQTYYDEDTDEEKKEDKYFLYEESYNHYGGTMFTWLGEDGFNQEYAVFSSDELDDAVKQSIKNLIDDVGLEGIGESAAENYLNTGQIRDWVDSFWTDVVYDDPGSYDIEKELSPQQEKYVNIYQTKIDKLNKEKSRENITNEELDDINSEINDIEELIEDINENPQGDYSEEQIGNFIESMVDDAIYDFPGWLDDHGFEKSMLLDFVDIDDLVEGLADDSEPGDSLNSYDGNMSEYKVNGVWYHVMRYN